VVDVDSCSDSSNATSLKLDEVTAVVTSCGRLDLLERTLDSFLNYNTFGATRIIVVEDGQMLPSSIISRYTDRDVLWLYTSERVGQIVAIDYAYSFVKTEYIFHLEDDWEFYASGFIEKSIALLGEHERWLQVYIRAGDDLNGHPLRSLHSLKGLKYQEVEFGYINLWHGFSFAPGLRRTSDYRLLGSYSRHVRHDPERPGSAEASISALYRARGFRAVALADNSGHGYVRHTGDGRHVD
jgi:hypothetical protein